LAVAEAQTLLLSKAWQELYIDVEEYQTGFVVPQGLIGLVSNNQDGTLKRINPDLRHGSNTSTAAGGATLAVPTGKIWDVLVIQATFLVDATVADRTCALFTPDLGLTGVAGTQPAQFFAASTVTASASQYAYILWFKGEDAIWTNDNGAVGRTEDEFPRTLTLNAGADIFAKITANKAAADNQGLDIIYIEHTAV